MDSQLYYEKYEERYQAVYAAGADRWGFSPDDKNLFAVLSEWVYNNHLMGKRIIDFACGEGAAGKILCDLGCIYHGVDLAPSAVASAQQLLAGYENASVSQLDMVKEPLPGPYDAALDSMGFHILITDQDRRQYLQNVYGCLCYGAPALFYCQSFRETAYEGSVDSFAQWEQIAGIDYTHLEKRYAKKGDHPVEVMIPRIAGRSKSESGYRKEFTEAGFVVDRFIPEPDSDSTVRRASIYLHKPGSNK